MGSSVVGWRSIAFCNLVLSICVGPSFNTITLKVPLTICSKNLTKLSRGKKKYRSSWNRLFFPKRKPHRNFKIMAIFFRRDKWFSLSQRDLQYSLFLQQILSRVHPFLFLFSTWISANSNLGELSFYFWNWQLLMYFWNFDTQYDTCSWLYVQFCIALNRKLTLKCTRILTSKGGRRLRAKQIWSI